MVYLDNAATSFPKPPLVYRETERCIKTYCGNSGRSSHRLAVAAAEKIYACRSAVSDLVNLGAPERVVFTLNTTYALNIAINSVVSNGDHIITGNFEHNSVIRPLNELKKTKYITVSQIDTFLPEEEMLKRLSLMINPKTKAVVLCHASNVLPLVLPLEKIGKLCKARGVLLIADCAQSAGVYDIDMQNGNIDIVCLPSHKSLLGIQGAGAMCISANVNEKMLHTMIQGGNGTASNEEEMPDFLPERFEAGTLPTPAVAALHEGIRFLNSVGLKAVREKDEKICRAIVERLLSFPNVKVYHPDKCGNVVSFNINGIPSEKTASLLDEKGVCVRAGLHCAPQIHRAIGTEQLGTVRASFGYFNTVSDADKLYFSIKEIIGGI